jgi:hypothetical protein
MLRNLTTLVVDLHGEARYTTEVAEREKNALENLTLPIRLELVKALLLYIF